MLNSYDSKPKETPMDRDAASAHSRQGGVLQNKARSDVASMGEGADTRTPNFGEFTMTNQHYESWCGIVVFKFELITDFGNVYCKLFYCPGRHD